MKYFGIRTNGSHAAATFKILSDLNLIRCDCKSYRRGAWSRSYEPIGPAVKWPFTQHFEMKADSIDLEVSKDQRTAYISRSGGASDTSSIFSSPKYEVRLSSSIEWDDDGIEVYPSWRHQIRSLEEEFRQRELV